MSRHWKFKPCEEALVERLFQCLEWTESGFAKLPKSLVALLVQRGCETPEDVSALMSCGLSNLRDPFELPDMDRAVDRIRRAIADGDKQAIREFTENYLAKKK